MRKWFVRSFVFGLGLYIIGVAFLLHILYVADNPGRCVQTSFAFGWPYFFIIGHLNIHMFDDLTAHYIGWFFDMCGK